MYPAENFPTGQVGYPESRLLIEKMVSIEFRDHLIKSIIAYLFEEQGKTSLRDQIRQSKRSQPGDI